jgi:hypothetical protein
VPFPVSSVWYDSSLPSTEEADILETSKHVDACRLMIHTGEFQMCVGERTVGTTSLWTAGCPRNGVRFLDGEEVFLFFMASRLALGSMQSPVQWVPRDVPR